MDTRDEIAYMARLARISMSAKDFRGVVHGDDQYGIVDVEFPTVLAAAQWANLMRVSGTARFRDTPRALDLPVVVQVPLHLF